MPFATFGVRPATGTTAVDHAREALGREVTRRATAILTELEAVAVGLAAGRTVTAEEILHAADRMDALRLTIAYRAMLAAAE